MQHPRRAALVLAFALVAAACGGESAPASAPPPPSDTEAATSSPSAGDSSPAEAQSPAPTPAPPDNETSSNQSEPPAEPAAPEDPVEERNADFVAPEDVPDPDAEQDLTERNIFAGVNIAIAEVDLADVVYDTFDGGSVTMAEASEATVLRLYNAIPPIDDPIYIPTADATWLQDDDLVLGFIAEDGSAWAHPHRILNLHEIVNTTFADQPVAITYCPLCGSGLVFDRRPNDLRHDGVLTFDNTSALYESDMVMVDPETNTYWWQAGGRGIVGNLTGTRLTLLSSRTTSWAQWKDLYPDSMVMADDQGRGPRYQVDIFEGYADRLNTNNDTRFPTSDDAFADERLRPGTRVIGFEVDGQPSAVAVLATEPEVVTIGDSGLVVFLDGRGGGELFSAEVNGEIATFERRSGGFVDSVSSSTWDSAGRAISGSAEGAQLERVPSSAAFWFAWVSTLDGATSQLFAAG